MTASPEYVQLFDANIRQLFTDALRLWFRQPSLAFFFTRALGRLRQAAQRRRSWAEQGVHVPPFMIASVTNRCNLNCKGCYARGHERAHEPDMSTDKLRAVLAEAEEVGVSIVLLAGGEPFTRPDLLDITAQFPGLVFPLFTNGLLIDAETVERLSQQRHVMPIVSLEGHAAETDQRRGAGVHRRLVGTMAALAQAGVFFGASMTATTANLDTILDDAFIDELADAGCRLFFFIEYVPVQPGTEALALGPGERALLDARLEALRRRVPALFVAFPGDEEQYGGCLAAGRGFVHLSPSGRLEPCPFSPYSDVSVQRMSLVEALQSPLLRAIREADGELKEASGGCALWEKRDWVASLLHAEEVPQAAQG